MSWPKVALGEVVSFLGGGTPSKKNSAYWGGNIPWATVKDIKGPSLDRTIDSITEEGLKNSASRLVPAGTVILPTRMALGKATVSTLPVAINQDLKAAIPKVPLSPRFLLHFLQSASNEIVKLGAGSTVQGVTLDKLTRLEIPLPPLELQRRIAEVLDKADAIRRQRQRSVQLIDDFLQTVFIHMFGDPVANPKRWPLQPLATLGTLDRGVSKHRPRNARELLGGKYPLIQTGEVSNAGLYIRTFTHSYSETGVKQSKMWPKGTLCITIAANIAKTGILTFDACFPDSVVGFTPHGKVASSVYVHFLFRFLQSILERNAPQAAQKNINLAILRTLEVPKPPYALQQEFDVIVAKAIAIRDDQISSLEVMNTAFSSIQQRAFKGELDVSLASVPSRGGAHTVSELHNVAPIASRHVAGESFLQPPQALRAILKKFDDSLSKGEQIPWSADYFKYRILGTQPVPFCFGDVMQKANAVFDESPYEEIKDIVMDLLGKGGGPVILRQSFDLHIDENTKEASGRKEIVFGPAV